MGHPVTAALTVVGAVALLAVCGWALRAFATALDEEQDT